MTMDNDPTERSDQRTSLLAAFARSPEKTDNTLVTMSAPPPTERTMGAQKVAVYRDEGKILERLRVLAAAAGSNWYYRFPVRTKEGGRDWIEGASIKLANDLARLYGNCEIDCRVTDLGDSWLIYARFYDLESGFVMTRPFQQRKSQRGMKTGEERALDIALQIGASKAIRNVICNSLQTFADFAFEEARGALVEKIGKNLEGSRKRMLERLSAKDIELIRVERLIGRAAKSWTAPDIAQVHAILESIEDGMTTIDDAFPEVASSQPVTPTDEVNVQTGGREGDAKASGSGETAGERFGPDERIERPTDTDPTDIAYERGKEAKAAGSTRRALPGEYRDASRTAEALAWEAGLAGQPKPERKR